MRLTIKVRIFLPVFLFAWLVLPAEAAGLDRLFASNIRVSCFTLKGLERRLQEVVNVMQVYNNDETTWQSKEGCAIVGGRAFTANSYIAAQHRVFNPGDLGFIGWIVTDKWLVPVEHFVYLDRAQEKAFRPAAIYSRKEYSLPAVCLERMIEINGVPIRGYQLSAGNQIDEKLSQLCSHPVVGTPPPRRAPKHRESKRRQWSSVQHLEYHRLVRGY